MLASRTTWLVTSPARSPAGVHVHCQPRGHELIAAVALLDLERRRPMITRPWQRLPVTPCTHIN